MSSNKHESPSMTYTLFLYRQELQRRECRYMRLNKTKFLLTDKLISREVRKLRNCSPIDLPALARELAFKNKLKKQMYRISKLENLGIKNANPNVQTTEL